MNQHDSWKSHNKEIEKNSATNTRLPNYLPSPEVIKQRAQNVRWLRTFGFNSRFICSVMQHNMPHITIVEKMIQKYGAEETFYRLLPFLAETEYDKECTDIWRPPGEDGHDND